MNVLCLDKTGTITENVMRVADVYGDHALRFAALASEKHPFDSMEKAILEAWGSRCPIWFMNTRWVGVRP